MLNLENLILEISKEFKNTGDKNVKLKLETIKAIKTEKQKIMTAANAPKEWTDALEINMIQKMAKERKENVEVYNNANRTDLAEAEAFELTILQEFLPAEVTDDEILEKIFEWKDKNLTPNMGLCIKYVKSSYPAADGAKIAKLVKANI